MWHIAPENSSSSSKVDVSVVDIDVAVTDVCCLSVFHWKRSWVLLNLLVTLCHTHLIREAYLPRKQKNLCGGAAASLSYKYQLERICCGSNGCWATLRQAAVGGTFWSWTLHEVFVLSLASCAPWEEGASAFHTLPTHKLRVHIVYAVHFPHSACAKVCSVTRLWFSHPKCKCLTYTSHCLYCTFRNSLSQLLCSYRVSHWVVLVINRTFLCKQSCANVPLFLHNSLKLDCNQTVSVESKQNSSS